MGFVGTLTGWDATKHAYNAVLASHLAEHAEPELKRQIAERIGLIIASVKNEHHRSVQSILTELSQKSRVVQMNFIAIACDSLGVCSLLRGYPFQAVNNPYSVNSDLAVERIPVSQRDFARRTGIIVNWPGDDVRIDFVSWLSSDPVGPKSDFKVDIETAITLADYTLLLGLIDRKIIGAIATELASQGLPLSTHDIAACSALILFKEKDLKELLRDAQMPARLVVTKWLMEKRIQAPQAAMFEHELYELYK